MGVVKLFIILGFFSLSSSFSKTQNNDKCFFSYFEKKDMLVFDRKHYPCFISSARIDLNTAYNDTLVSYYSRTNRHIYIARYGTVPDVDTIDLNLFLDKHDKLNVTLTCPGTNMLDYLFVNEDSIFLSVNYLTEDMSRFIYVIYLINRHAEVQKKWNITELMRINDAYFCLNSSHYRTNMAFLNNNIIVTSSNIITQPYIAYNTDTVPSVLVFDLEQNKGHFIYAQPEVYGQGDFYGNHSLNQSIIFLDDSTFVLSYPVDHYLYKYHINGSLIKKSKCQSKYIHKMRAFEKGTVITSENLINAQENFPYYHQIVFDTHNQLIYRVAFLENRKDFSVMVIDKNLNVLGEYIIPSGHLRKYLPMIVNQNNFFAEIIGNRLFKIVGSYVYKGE